MKKIIVVLLGVIFTLVTGSIHYISADDSTDNQRPEIVVVTKDSKFQLHIQVIFRNAQDQLIGATEGTYSAYIPHKLTDVAFDTMFGEKEIVTVDGIKYEKVQITFTPTLQQRYMSIYPVYSEVDKLQVEFSDDSVTKMHEENKNYSNWKLHYCIDFGEEHGFQCVAMFFALVPSVTLEPSDTVTQQWTILRVMN